VSGHRALSLRARLVAGIAFVVVVLGVVSAVITLTTRNQLIDQVDRRLAGFAPGPGNGSGGPLRMPDARHLIEEQLDPNHRDRDGDGDGRISDAYLGFVGPDGVLNTRFGPNVNNGTFSPPVLGDALPAGSDTRVFTAESEDGQTTYRVLAQRLDTLVVVTALPIDDVQATLADLLWIEVFGSVAILVALGLVGWWVIHLGIRPVRQMTEAAEHIAAGDLDVRLPQAASGTESAALAGALNQMLARIQHALAERAAADGRLRRFVADASHELRTPITTIRGYAELYRHGGLDEREALDDAMRRTEQEAARMGRLVEDMLTLAKLDEQRPLDIRPVDVAAIARDAAADARVAQPARPVELDLAASPALVAGDDDRLRQVVGNVVGNALVHTDPQVTVTVRVQATADAVLLEVVDQGAGMDPEIAERITERFFRADPARARSRGGSGLGMSIVADTMTAHGGSVEVDSAPGMGTTVRLRLPALPVVPTAAGVA